MVLIGRLGARLLAEVCELSETTANALHRLTKRLRLFVVEVVSRTKRANAAIRRDTKRFLCPAEFPYGRKQPIGQINVPSSVL